MRRLLSGAVLASSLLAVACGSSASQADIDAVTALTGSAAAGESVFTTNCKVCHGDDAKSGTAKRDLPDAAKSETDKAISTILTGEDEMQSFKGVLTNQQIADVIAYLKTK